MQLNPEQEIAANHFDGPCLCTAVPGSGKTATLVERTARMVSSGIAPESIVCITFTNKAAKEMGERVAKRVGEDIAQRISISTFHRLCLRIIRRYGERIGYSGEMTIVDPDEQISIICQLARKKEIELSKPDAKTISHHVNDNRENLQTDDDLIDRFEDIKKPNYYYVASDYLKHLNSNNLIDLTGILSEAVRLLRENPDVVDKIQKHIKYLMCDETQDTNKAQFELINLLMSHNGNIFAVGDLDQSIYGFRGARYENISDFVKKWNAKKISLSTNYRSTPQILKVAKKLIDHNIDRDAVDLKTGNKDGCPVKSISYFNEKVESDSTAEMIKQIVSQTNYSYKDVAVFYRLNSMSRSVEMSFLSHKIPHTVIGNFSFFDRKEVKDCISMLRFLANPKDGIAFHRIANKPKRSIGDTAIGKIELFAEKNNCDILAAINNMQFSNKKAQEGIKEVARAFSFDYKNLTVAESLDRIIKDMRYKEYIDENKEDCDDRWGNVQELIKDAAQFSSSNGELNKYLDQLALISSSDKDPNGDSVSVMSLHASKGLEFPIVFILGCEQGILPHSRAVYERKDGLSEERRLAYVGFTRAKNMLVVSFCKSRQDSFGGKLSYRKSLPSQFLKESGLIEK